ncbi:MAG: glycosyltransferase [Hyphomicrobiaceae bacterium]
MEQQLVLTGGTRPSALTPRVKKLAIWLIDRAGSPSLLMERREMARRQVRAARALLLRASEQIVPERRRRTQARGSFIAFLEGLRPKVAETPAAIGTVAAAEGASLTGARIAVFIPGFLSGAGGAEKVAGQVAHLLGRAGAKVDLLCRPREEPGPFPYSWDDRIVQVRPIREYVAEDVAALGPGRYDLAICFGMPGFYTRIPWVARMLGCPFIIQECTNPAAMQQALKLSSLLQSDREAYWLRQSVLSEAAAIRFTVPAYAETVEPGNRGAAYAFYNAFVRPGSEGEAAGTPARRIICVGGMKNANKNGMAAVTAFADFAGGRTDWRMHLYGVNNFRSEMTALAEARAPGQIVDEGIVRDVERIYGDAWGLMIPSFQEGLPNVIIEAFSYGVPCIGFADCPGVKDLIVDGVNGFLVDRGEVGALTRALAALAEPATRARLSANARAFADEALTVERWESNWLNMVGRVLVQQAGREEMPQGNGLPGTPARHAVWRRLLDTYPVMD